MRLLRLEFEAIGPFPGHHVIDLEALGAGGLFLLEGPTGAGKTTIIDAIVFALYGDVSGAASSKDRLVSTHRAEGVTPFVELTFENGNGIYRVRRTPAFTRAKQRGTGTVTANATCRLYTLTSPTADPQLVARNIQEAATELARIIGLSKEQFTQTVVLPQGQFAEFLRAKPEERRKLLQEIFGTQQFELIQDELRVLAAEHRAAVEQATNAVDSARRSFLALTDDDVPEGMSFTDWATHRFDRLAAQLDEANRVESAARDAKAERDRELAAERARAERIARRTALQKRREALDGRRDAVEEMRRETQAARRAGLVAPVLSARQRRDREATEADEAWRRAWEKASSDELVAPLLNADNPDAEDEALSGAVVEWRVRSGELRPLVAQERRLAEQDRSLTDERRALDDLLADVERRRKQIALAEERADAADQHLAQLRAEADDLDPAQVAAAQAERVLEAHREAAALSVDVEKAGRAADQAAEAAHRDAVAYADLHRRWIDASAGRLAAELRAGEPCPVCGSEEHPLPAVAAADAVDADTVDAALSESQRSNSALATAQAREAGLKERHATLTAALTGDLPSAERDSQAASERVAVARRAATDHAAVTRDLRRLRESLENERAAVAELAATAAARAATWDQRRERWEQESAEVDAARGGENSVASVAAGLDRAVEAAERVTALAQQALDARARADDAVADLRAALAEQSFPTLAAMRDAERDPSALERLDREIRDYDGQVSAVADQLADADIATLPPDAAADVAPLEVAAADADRAVGEAVERRAGIEQLLHAANRAWAAYVEAEHALSRLDETSRPFVAMADLARGDNPRHLTLATYVLLRRFDEIVDRANQRLAAMTSGRYELVRSEEREGREQRTGLGLQVVDHASHDAHRTPDTLSGGETFVTSLALALGLAEAVTAEAGGIELQTLFIDEGFGSLDPETLDLVMQQLGLLRQGGRAVGVISHVTEMKQQIAARISVRRRPDGSSTLSTTEDALTLA